MPTVTSLRLGLVLISFLPIHRVGIAVQLDGTALRGRKNLVIDNAQRVVRRFLLEDVKLLKQEKSSNSLPNK
jgi:hypothetical protein